MDVIALHQAGFDCAVASLGTSLTEEQARLMASRGKGDVVVCYDSDQAGRKAAQRAIDLLKPAGLAVRVLRMSGAKDPDEFIRKNGPEAFENLINRSSTDVEYRLDEIRAGHRLEENDDRVEYLQQAAQYLATLESAVEREVFSHRLAKETGVSQQAILNEVEQALRTRRRREKASRQRQEMNPARQAQPGPRQLRYENIRSARSEEGLLALALSDRELLNQAAARVSPLEFSSPFLAKVYDMALRRSQGGGEAGLPQCLALLEPEEGQLLAQIVQRFQPPAAPQQALEDYISTIQYEHLKKANQEDDKKDTLLELAERKLQQERERGGK